jgi:serine/threonine-protein kinase
MAEPDPLPENGDSIGPYRIVRVLSRGGMGEVFLARDDRLNRWVAIKRIRHDGDTPILRQRLLQEARAVGGLHHPAIVTVYDLLEHEGDDCIVMEYVEGENLAETVRRGPLVPALAVRLAGTVASGLAAAHESGFIHRDLKAENVMVTPAGDAKILDFGLAKPIGITGDDPPLTVVGCVVGTCRSMSPEQARGAEVDERSDLFSLGVLIYEMLTASSPFQGSNALATLTKVISERPPCLDTRRPGLPPRLVALVFRLLAKEPDDRPQSAAEVARELDAIAAALSSSGDTAQEETVFDLPTVVHPSRGGGPTPPAAPQPPAHAPLSEEVPQPRPRHFLRRPAILSSLAVLAVGAALFFRWNRTADPKPAAPLRLKLRWVMVLNPPVAGNDTELQRAASALVQASLKTLGHLQGIVPIGPIVGSPVKTTEAEDLLAITLQKSGHRGIIKLSRISGRTGKVLGDPISFGTSIDARRKLQELEREVEVKLTAAFSLRPPRDDESPEDRATVFGIKYRIDEGEAATESELVRLREIIEISPNFLEAQLLEAEIAIMAYQQSRNETDRQRALQLIAKAEKLAPGDPRPLQSKFKVALVKPRGHEAKAILDSLERLDKRNPQIPALRASLADNQPDAHTAWEKAVDYEPSWRNLLRLARSEEELGLVEEARSHLRQILEDSPRNLYARRRLAELELDYGDPARAETIYRGIIKSSPTFFDHTNLGTARVLLHRYDEAIGSFHEALRIEPENAAAKLNLADAELALGHAEKAEVHYGEACRTTTEEMIKAQCLAHGGRRREATTIVRKALEQNPDNPEIIRSAALVYTLAGDTGRALKAIEDARAKGMGPNWFKFPSFKPLFADPKFKELMNGKGRGVSSANS